MAIDCNSLKVNQTIVQAWEPWLKHASERCHIHFKLEGGQLETHVNIAIESAFLNITALTKHFDNIIAKSILEVGSSTGINCLALSKIYPDASIIGVEPDNDAVIAGNILASENDFSNVEFKVGHGEKLPVDDECMDIIFCRTVIEHVDNPSGVIKEMSRVLRKGGTIYIDAPNYIWPYEPHLGVVTIPLLGKKFVKVTALLQGKSKHIQYLDHLKFVTPKQIEKYFFNSGLKWVNIFDEKLQEVLDGNIKSVKKYKFLSMLLRVLSILGLREFLRKIIVRSGFYPSIIYKANK